MCLKIHKQKAAAVADNPLASNQIALNDNIASSLNSLRQQGGYYIANEYGLLAVSGEDASTYLQSQTSNDISQLALGHGQFTCLLDRKAHVLAYFHLFKVEDCFYIIAEKTQLSAIIDHLEQFRFAAIVNIVDLSQTGQFISIAGPNCNQFFEQLQTDLYNIFQHSVTGDHGYFIWAKKADYDNLSTSITKTASKLGFSELTKEIIEIARII